ncbi:hypothetical protein A2412_03860 [Candidatus Peribacteria bacterium RIFOXYC1_FULL_58_8]|nr:MAG: hypothetical protein A2398_01190 [Candidatus Peribacteria bacterium RIFOXYB1_FULL_57_12]OGJ82147.1 MAG: hypothetical protein A2412_03860 [Candidatus Peribacteria bacterium RIFOXYC1_FULL_58_8]
MSSKQSSEKQHETREDGILLSLPAGSELRLLGALLIGPALELDPGEILQSAQVPPETNLPKSTLHQKCPKLVEQVPPMKSQQTPDGSKEDCELELTRGEDEDEEDEGKEADEDCLPLQALE